MRATCSISRILVFVALLACSRGRVCALDLVKDGEPCATIVMADGEEKWPKWGAVCLRHYLRLATDASLDVKPESGAPKTGNLISVGHTRMAKQAGLRTDDLKWDGCRMVVKGRTLFLIGRDATSLPSCRSVRHYNGAGAQGSFRAVALFLEEVVGCRWYLPTRQGVVVPERRNVSAPDDLDRRFVPAFAYISTPTRWDPIGRWANNHRVAMLRRNYGGHSWPAHVRAEEYFEEHPKYFRVDESGKRTAKANMVCTSNGEVWRIMLEKIRAEFDKGYDVVQLGASDGWLPCLCPECMKLDRHRSRVTITRDNPCEKVWVMHRWIIDECRKSHPDKKLMVMIYGPTGWPSKKWDRLPDNCIGEMAPMTPERLAAWRGKIPMLTNWAYWWWANTMDTVFIPVVSPQYCQMKLREFRDLGVVGMAGAPQGNWGMGGPAYYVWHKLLGDPEANVEKIVSQYCDDVYGAAGRVMYRFFHLFHRRSTLARPLQLNARPTPSYHAEDAITYLYPPKIVFQLDRLLTKAESLADTERAQGWVKHTRDCFDGMKHLATAFALKRGFEARPSRESLAAVKEAVDAFEAWRRRILLMEESEIKRWFPDHDEMCAILLSNGSNAHYGELHFQSRLAYEEIQKIREGKLDPRGIAIGADLAYRQVQAPITWDFDRLLANIGRPPEEKLIRVKPTKQPPRLDGRLDSAEWQGADAATLSTHKSPASAIRDGALTRVRMMFDAERLYVAYECMEPMVDNLKLKPVGRDGNVYGNDEVELFLNPDESSERKFLQFMASPVEGALFDARKGYVEDPLDPNFAKLDVAWNGDWTCAFQVDRQAKKWTVEMAIRLDSLGAAAPKPGTVWRGNFARLRRAHGTDLFSWVAETFGGNPELFGEIVFGHQPAPPQRDVNGPVKKEAQEPMNFLDNGSLEEIAMDDQPEGWRLQLFPAGKAEELASSFGLTSERAHTGKRSLKIDYSNLPFAKVLPSAQITVGQGLSAARTAALRGKRVKLSFWIYYEVFPEDVKYLYLPGPYLMLRTWGAKGFAAGSEHAPSITINGKSLAGYGYTSASQIVGRWVKFETTGAIPTDTKRIDLHGGAVSKSRHGEVNPVCLYLDDVRVELAQPEPRAPAQ